jgi:hypothetical protein
MKKESVKQLSLNGHLGCLGNFNNQDPICRKLCALSLRCAIDSEKNTQMEFLEDLISYNDLFIKIQ